MVSYKMTTDVGHISSELCLLGCHISTGKPLERGFQSFSLWKWRFVDSFTRGREVSHSRNTDLQHGPHSGWGQLPGVCTSQFHLFWLVSPSSAQGIQLGLHTLQTRQTQCIWGPLMLVAASIRQFCPKATTLLPLLVILCQNLKQF